MANYHDLVKHLQPLISGAEQAPTADQMAQISVLIDTYPGQVSLTPKLFQYFPQLASKPKVEIEKTLQQIEKIMLVSQNTTCV